MPTAVDPRTGGRDKSHQFLVLGRRLKVIQLSRRPYGVAVGRVVNNVADQFAVQKNATTVLQAIKVILSGFGH